MKILIEVPEEELKIYKRDRQIETLYPSDIKKFILSRYYNDIIDATIIPDNATNGDVFTSIYKPYKVQKHTLYVSIYQTEHDFKQGIEWLVFVTNWWNAPYKKGE